MLFVAGLEYRTILTLWAPSAERTLSPAAQAYQRPAPGEWGDDLRASFVMKLDWGQLPKN